MAFVLNALIIDTSSAALKELELALRPEFKFDYLEIVNTVHKAVQQHLDRDFQVCFIGDKFPEAEVASFFKDYQKLAKISPCIFIQFKDKIPENFDRLSLSNLGYHCVISKKGTHADKQVLNDAIQPLLLNFEYEEAVSALPDLVENITKELDKIALENKRGKSKTFSTIYGDHLKASVRKFDKLHEDYISRLAKAAEKATPFVDPELNIPESVTKKNLPHLTRTQYVGQSHRVFERLQKMHGEKKDDKKDSPDETE